MTVQEIMNFDSKLSKWCYSRRNGKKVFHSDRMCDNTNIDILIST